MRPSYVTRNLKEGITSVPCTSTYVSVWNILLATKVHDAHILGITVTRAKCCRFVQTEDKHPNGTQEKLSRGDGPSEGLWIMPGISLDPNSGRAIQTHGTKEWQERILRWVVVAKWWVDWKKYATCFRYNLPRFLTCSPGQQMLKVIYVGSFTWER